jgi:hypothetical protein
VVVIVSVRYDLKFDELENICISIKKPRSKPFLIVTWYGPPNSVVDKFNHLETLQGKLDAENIEYYVVGNLNCGLSSTVLDHSSRLLSDIAETFDLQQLIAEQTRITSSSSTLIDHIFTNAPDRVGCSGVSHISISDHSLVYAFRKLSARMPTRGRQEYIYYSKL